MSHAIKIESLELNIETANQIEEHMHNFLIDLGYSKDRISNLECRSRDGFSPYSHNNGGLEAIAFRDQYSCRFEGTGFENADATIEKYHGCNLEYFFESKGMPKDSELPENLQEEFDEYCQNDSDSSVLFSVDMMLKSETELNIRMCVCVKDAPYHRQYDDLLEFDITFKSPAGLRQKLERLLKNEDVKQFSSNLSEAY